MDDLDRLVREFAPVVREFVSDSNIDLIARIKALEDGTVVAELRSEVLSLKGELEILRSRPEPDITPVVKSAVDEAIAAIPLPQDGKDGQSVTVDDIWPLVAEELAKAVASIPVPQDGSDGKDGASVDPLDVEAMVAKAVSEIPKPQDGKSVTVEDLEPLIATEVTKAVEAIPPAKDGVGVVSALIDRDGHLIVTLSDGATKDVGAVVGRDADLDDMHRTIVAELEKWPRPKDGKDGLGFEDMDVIYDDLGHMTVTFERGDIVKTWPMHNPVFAGVFKEGTAYRRGALVQFGGHVWTAKDDTDGSVKPDEHTADGKRVWVLSVRRGREGKPGANGANGKDGRDFRIPK